MRRIHFVPQTVAWTENEAFSRIGSPNFSDKTEVGKNIFCNWRGVPASLSTTNPFHYISHSRQWDNDTCYAVLSWTAKSTPFIR